MLGNLVLLRMMPIAQSNTLFPKSGPPWRKIEWIWRYSNSSQSPSVAKSSDLCAGVSAKWVTKGAASMYGPVKTGILVKLYSLYLRQKSPKERVGCNLPLTQQADLQRTMSYSFGKVLNSLSCQNFSPAFRRRFVITAASWERRMPQQSPALAMWRLSLRMTAVKAQDPTVLYVLSLRFFLKIQKKARSTSRYASTKLLSTSWLVDSPRVRLAWSLLQRNSLRCLEANSD